MNDVAICPECGEGCEVIKIESYCPYSYGSIEGCIEDKYMGSNCCEAYISEIDPERLIFQ